jgi:ABC-type nitrate/sulfonate/bicarbonate transport system substrate-binding protein
VVSLATVGERRAEAQRFLQAIARAVTFMQSQREDTAMMLAEWVGLDQRVAEQTYDEAQIRLSWSNEKTAAQQAIETAIAFAKEADQIPKHVELTDVADLSFYP